MKKHTHLFLIGVLLLFVTSTLQCEEADLNQLPYVPESDKTIYSTSFPLIWKSRTAGGNPITVRGSWMDEDMPVAPGRVAFVNSPMVNETTSHTFTVISQNNNCTKTYDLTFTTPLSSATVLPTTLTFQQTFTTYGSSFYNVSAVFEENGMVKLDIVVSGKDRCPPYSTNFKIQNMTSWQQFLDEVGFFGAESQGQSWNYKSIPAKCDATLVKITLADTFLQSADMSRVRLPEDIDSNVQVPTFTATMLLDDYSCSGERTAFTDAVAKYAANLGDILCQGMSKTSSQCYIGRLRSPIQGCPNGYAVVGDHGHMPSPNGVVTQPTSENNDKDKDSSRTAAFVILMLLIAGVALLVLSVIGVWVSKKVASFRKKNPPAAIEMFIQSEDQIFTVAEEDPNDTDNEPM